jgi:hypothetical protein
MQKEEPGEQSRFLKKAAQKLSDSGPGALAAKRPGPD